MFSSFLPPCALDPSGFRRVPGALAGLCRPDGAASEVSPGGNVTFFSSPLQRSAGRRKRLELALQAGESLARAPEFFHDFVAAGRPLELLELGRFACLEVVDYNRDEEIEHDEDADQYEG